MLAGAGRLGDLYGRQAEPGRPRGLRATVQDGGHRRPAQGGQQDQPLPLRPRQCHIRPSRWQVYAHSLQRLQAHQASVPYLITAKTHSEATPKLL